jgi:hypothetical protein
MIDLWDIGTYDEEILGHLERHKEIIDGYFDLEGKKNIMVAKLATWEPIQPNPFAPDYMAAVESLGGIMSTKTIRAFHYSRMTDDEIEAVLSEGIVPTSIEYMKQRVDRQVSAGRVTIEQATRIITQRPPQTTDFGVRKGFWSTSSPIHPDDRAVDLLVGHWGGESVYWQFTGTQDEEMIGLLKGIGRGRVIEIAIPLKEANGGLAGFSVARNAVREYARSLGYELYPECFDLEIEHSLPADSILRIHSEGEDDYKAIGKDYPVTFGYQDFAVGAHARSGLTTAAT